MSTELVSHSQKLFVSLIAPRPMVIDYLSFNVKIIALLCNMTSLRFIISV